LAYAVRESGDQGKADRAVDLIAERFITLVDYPRAGRVRDDLRRGLRSLVAGDYLIVYRVVRVDVVIVQIVHGRRDLRALFR
jgi:plasmid stabilization system protein ParE